GPHLAVRGAEEALVAQKRIAVEHHDLRQLVAGDHGDHRDALPFEAEQFRAHASDSAALDRCGLLPDQVGGSSNTPILDLNWALRGSNSRIYRISHLVKAVRAPTTRGRTCHHYSLRPALNA